MIVKMITPSIKKALGIAIDFYDKPEWIINSKVESFGMLFANDDGEDYMGEVCHGLIDMAVFALLDYSLLREEIYDAFCSIDMDVFGQMWSDGDGYKNFYPIEELAKVSFAKKWKLMYPEIELTEDTILCVFETTLSDDEMWDENNDVLLFYGIPIDHPYRKYLLEAI